MWYFTLDGDTKFSLLSKNTRKLISCIFAVLLLHYLDRIDIELKWKSKLIISFHSMFAKYTIYEKNNIKYIKYKMYY